MPYCVLYECINYMYSVMNGLITVKNKEPVNLFTSLYYVVVMRYKQKFCQLCYFSSAHVRSCFSYNWTKSLLPSTCVSLKLGLHVLRPKIYEK